MAWRASSVKGGKRAAPKASFDKYLCGMPRQKAGAILFSESDVG